MKITKFALIACILACIVLNYTKVLAQESETNECEILSTKEYVHDPDFLRFVIGRLWQEINNRNEWARYINSDTPQEEIDQHKYITTHCKFLIEDIEDDPNTLSLDNYLLLIAYMPFFKIDFVKLRKYYYGTNLFIILAETIVGLTRFTVKQLKVAPIILPIVLFTDVGIRLTYMQRKTRYFSPLYFVDHYQRERAIFSDQDLIFLKHDRSFENAVKFEGTILYESILDSYCQAWFNQKWYKLRAPFLPCVIADEELYNDLMADSK